MVIHPDGWYSTCSTLMKGNQAWGIWKSISVSPRQGTPIWDYTLSLVHPSSNMKDTPMQMCLLIYEPVVCVGVSALCSAWLCFACAAAGPGEEREGGKKAAAEESAAGEEGRVACNSPAAGGRLPGGGGAENRWARQGEDDTLGVLEHSDFIKRESSFFIQQIHISVKLFCNPFCILGAGWNEHWLSFTNQCNILKQKKVPSWFLQTGWETELQEEQGELRQLQELCLKPQWRQVAVISAFSTIISEFYLCDKKIFSHKNVSGSILALAPIVSRSVSGV